MNNIAAAIAVLFVMHAFVPIAASLRMTRPCAAYKSFKRCSVHQRFLQQRSLFVETIEKRIVNDEDMEKLGESLSVHIQIGDIILLKGIYINE